jgi:G3E family GTPase
LRLIKGNVLLINKPDYFESRECDHKKNSLKKINTNLQGAKSFWVPKSLSN